MTFLTIALIITLLLCIGLIFYLIYTNNLRSRFSSIESEKITAESQREIISAQLVDAKNELAEADKLTRSLIEENSRLCERIKFIEEEKERILTDSEFRFRNIANEILIQNTTAFKEQNEARLNEILSPLKENIEQFKKSIHESYSNEARERFSLQERIKELIELNQTIGKEAKDLTLALKGNNKIQGNWGEMILETILEKSGLQRNREFFVQESTINDEGKRLFADVVINYPDGRKIIIDSKVSLNAYIDLVNCNDTLEAETYKKNHLASIRKHINELKNKKYQDYINGDKAEFVMMFIPNEAAYVCAMQLDHKLWQDAYDNRVLIISPTHLISALRLVEQLWRHDRQTRNAIEIATESGKMYDKLVGFVDDMISIEKAIDNAHTHYNKAINKLSSGHGNIIDKAKKLKNMGAKAAKSLPEKLTNNDSNN